MQQVRTAFRRILFDSIVPADGLQFTGQPELAIVILRGAALPLATLKVVADMINVLGSRTGLLSGSLGTVGRLTSCRDRLKLMLLD